MIPTEAVEAAARNLYVSEHGPWDGVGGITSAHLTRARAALEAAHPVLLAELRASRATNERLNRRAQRAEAAADALTNEGKRSGLRLDRIRSCYYHRAEDAEAALSRIEELCRYLDTLADGDKHYAKLVRNAVTGDGA